jgi:nitronate monooxygenase
MWPDRRLLDLFRVEHPILLAPMAGAMDTELAVAVANAGGLGALPAGMLGSDQVRAQVAQFREATGGRPVNLNFFAHKMPIPNNERENAWRDRLNPYYVELGVDPAAPVPLTNRLPFDAAICAVVEELKPEVVSFHYGLPHAELVKRIRESGSSVICSATTVAEARFLEQNGCDAIIAQGLEAGGHRGMFLSDDLSTQVGLFTLLPQIVDAVNVPVIASGGIADGRGIVAAFALVQRPSSSAPRSCPESKILPPHRAALRMARSDSTVLTNVLSGRPARALVRRVVRELGPISQIVPEFPLAAGALAPLHAKAQAQGSGDFSPMLAGQEAILSREVPAADLVGKLVRDVQERRRAKA